MPFYFMLREDPEATQGYTTGQWTETQQKMNGKM